MKYYSIDHLVRVLLSPWNTNEYKILVFNGDTLHPSIYVISIYLKSNPVDTGFVLLFDDLHN